MKWFLKPENLATILDNRWGLFTILGGIIYTYHLLWTITGVDKFTDITRFNMCGDAKDKYEASAIFDAAVGMVTIFHMIEWVRQAIFLTCALVGVNLVSVYYCLSINVPYGVIAMLTAIISRNSSNGSDCAEEGK